MNARIFTGLIYLTTLVLFIPGPLHAEQKSRQQRATDQEVYLSLGDEPPSMDPTKQADTVSGFWLGHLYEGLMAYDQQGNVVLGAAEKMDVSPDKKTYTFKIRKNAKWHDGKPLRAQDFEFALRRLVDPAYASEYAFIASVASIDSATDIIAKKKPLDTLAVKSIDDHTLEIKLSRPVAFFDALMAFKVFFPVRKDVVEKFGERFSTTPESIIGNGPYKMDTWVKEQSMRLVKADTYWNAKAIKIKAIASPAIVKDTQALFNAFNTGAFDFTGVNTPEVIKQAQDAKHKIGTFQTGCTSYMEMNTREGRPFANKELRLAIRDGINRGEFVNKIIGIPGYKAALGIVPDMMPGSKSGNTYRKEAPLSARDSDVAAVKKHLKAYVERSKSAKAPAFTILAGDSTRAKKYAEYWQSVLAKLLDTEVKIENVPFKTRLQKTRDHQFDIVLAGWCPDYRDAMTFIDLFTSKNDNNNTGWTSEKMDSLVEQAANEPDAAKRIQLMAQAEKLLWEEAAVVPTDYSGSAYVVAEGLKGLRRGLFGTDPDLRFAEWSKAAAK